MIYTHVAAGLLAAALASVGTWQVQNWRYSAQIDRMKAAYAQATAEAVTKAREDEQKLRQGVEDALKKATERANANRAAADRARAESDSLRTQLRTASLQVPGATCSSVREYATTVSTILGECVAAYQGLGEAAAGHASDVRTLIDAWPRRPAAP